jgi:hypothetical protein
MSSVDTIVEGFAVGCLAAVTIIYAFQTKVAYPDFVLKILEHPWILLFIAVVSIMTYRWSPAASVLMLLMLAAFVMDTFIFARHLPIIPRKRKDYETPAERLSHESAAHALPFDQQIIMRVPGVGVTATESGVALSSVPLPVPLYPVFNTDDPIQAGRFSLF